MTCNEPKFLIAPLSNFYLAVIKQNLVNHGCLQGYKHHAPIVVTVVCLSFSQVVRNNISNHHTGSSFVSQFLLSLFAV